MINIIKKHIECYLKMQIQDVAKLLYQSEFGGGHMIADSGKSLKRIQEEYEKLNLEDVVCMSEVEPIGDGMCRIYLTCLSNGVRAEVLNQIFVQSANHRTGTVRGLEVKIKEFLEACKNGEVPYREAEVMEYFIQWKKQGYPAMSHSDIYRESYYPAYRVIEETYVKTYEVIQMIEKAKRPLVVAIDGKSASGKTTMGNLLHENFPESNLFHMDDFFLQPHQRTDERLAEVGGNVDYERFKSEIIDHLSDKDGLKYRSYNCGNQKLGEEIFVPWSPLVIIEGAYSHHPYLGDVYDLRIFCEIEKEEQEARILKRNGAEMLKRFQNEWIPMENKYFETYKIKEKSGLQ